jgi:hypothetical protein
MLIGGRNVWGGPRHQPAKHEGTGHGEQDRERHRRDMRSPPFPSNIGRETADGAAEQPIKCAAVRHLPSPHRPRDRELAHQPRQRAKLRELPRMRLVRASGSFSVSGIDASSSSTGTTGCRVSGLADFAPHAFRRFVERPPACGIGSTDPAGADQRQHHFTAADPTSTFARSRRPIAIAGLA